MKKLITIILLLSSLMVKGQYHIRVECFYMSEDQRFTNYIISFTNNNWKHRDTLKHSFDISDPDITPFNVCHQVLLFQNMYTAKDDAIFFAKKFISYKQCIDFNKLALLEYKMLIGYRKAHPFKKKVQKLTKVACCKLTNIY